MAEKLQKVLTPQIERRRDDHKYDDEIDLVQVAVKAVSIVKQYKTFLALSIMAGILIGVVAFIVIQPIYKSTLVIEIPALEKHELQELISGYKESVIANDRGNIQKHMKDVEVVDVTSDKAQSFLITVTSSDKSVFPTLEASLTNFITSNKFVTTEWEQERTKLEETLKMLKAEEAKIASVLDRTFESKQVFDTDFSLADLAKLKVDMEKEKIALETQLKNRDALKVIQGFVTPSKAENKSAVKIIGLSLVGSIVLACAIIFLIEIFKLVKAYEAKAHPKTVSFFK